MLLLLCVGLVFSECSREHYEEYCKRECSRFINTRYGYMEKIAYDACIRECLYESRREGPFGVFDR